jgi:hypothetical protein
VGYSIERWVDGDGVGVDIHNSDGFGHTQSHSFDVGQSIERDRVMPQRAMLQVDASAGKHVA